MQMQAVKVKEIKKCAAPARDFSTLSLIRNWQPAKSSTMKVAVLYEGRVLSI